MGIMKGFEKKLDPIALTDGHTDTKTDMATL